MLERVKTLSIPSEAVKRQKPQSYSKRQELTTLQQSPVRTALEQQFGTTPRSVNKGTQHGASFPACLLPSGYSHGLDD